MEAKTIFRLTGLAVALLMLNVFFINLASANLVVDPAKLGILRLQLFPMSPAVAIREFTVGNTYNVSMHIELSPVEDMKNLTSMSETNFTLQPNENKTIEYTITVNEPGYYSGGILIKASIENRGAIGYKDDLIIFVSKSNVEYYFYVVIAIIVAAIVLVFIFLFRKVARSKKGKG